jgi:hypothetical protein
MKQLNNLCDIRTMREISEKYVKIWWRSSKQGLQALAETRKMTLLFFKIMGVAQDSW